MEREESYRVDPLENCWFDEICKIRSEFECNRCRDNGIHYIVSAHYLKKTNIPKDLLNSKLRRLILSGAETRVLQYLNNIKGSIEAGDGLYIWSETTGNGKSSVAVIAALRYLGISVDANMYDIDNRRVYFLNVPEFLEDLRLSFNDRDSYVYPLMDELKSMETSPKLLIMDDLGAENPSNWVIERLYSIINFRVANGLATIYTSNLSPEGLRGRLGNRVYSRVIGKSTVINFSGQDRRCQSCQKEKKR